MKKGFISGDAYKKIVETTPVACVDLVVKRRNSFLLLKRTEEPAKGKWWFPGGRIFFNEKIKEAVKRKLKEEINVSMKKEPKFLGTEETMFKRGKFGKPMHTINSVFLIELSGKEAEKIKIDSTSSNYGWFNSTKVVSLLYLKKFLKKAGFK